MSHKPNKLHLSKSKLKIILTFNEISTKLTRPEVVEDYGDRKYQSYMSSVKLTDREPFYDTKN